MGRVKKNIIANFGGSLWTATLSLFFIPVYLNFLGVEAYALVGVFATLMATFAVLDMGLIQTLTRELARLSIHPNSARDMRDLSLTLEVPYVATGALIAALLVWASPWLASEWFDTSSLPMGSLQNALVIMGIIIGVQWPIGLYSAGLVGMQEQVVLNVVNGTVAIGRGAVSTFALWALHGSIEVFFISQFLVSLVHVAVVRYLLWRKLPAFSENPRFRKELLIKVWRFAAGVTGISLVSTLLMQLDKIILSKLLTLDVFGYYVIANTISMNVYRLFGPIYSAVYPRLTSLYAQGSIFELVEFYHKSAKLISVAVFPAAITIIVFSEEIISVWLGASVSANAVAPIASILVFGTLINGVMHVPYGLQLASGWTSLALWFGILSVGVFGALLFVMTEFYGVIGAALAWPIQQFLYFIITVPIMHKRLLRGEQWRWYVFDVGYPFCLSLLPVVLGRFLFPVEIGAIATFFFLVFMWLLSVFFVVLGTPVLRREVFRFVNSKRI